jgi:hypothetical protein
MKRIGLLFLTLVIGMISSSAVGLNIAYDQITGKFAAGFKDISGDRAVLAREAYVNYDNGSYAVRAEHCPFGCMECHQL